MTSQTATALNRRSFLGGLLMAACAGCGKGGPTKDATAVKTQSLDATSLGAKIVPLQRLDESGMRPKVQEQVRSLLASPKGLILCCGVPRAATTNLVYAIIREMDLSRRKVVTLEDPIVRHMEGFTQVAVDTRNGQSYVTRFPSLLAQNPDVVMIGAIRDKETAELACKEAVKKQLILSTVDTPHTEAVPGRLIELGVQPSEVASALTGVLAQLQVRVLCNICKEPYRPSPDFLAKANLPADKINVFYRPPKSSAATCEGCNGSGYAGWTGIFELLVINDEIRALIRDNAPPKAIKSEARKLGMIYVEEDGLRQVILGRTSIDEVLRALTTRSGPKE